jgi:hypothetical protein
LFVFDKLLAQHFSIVVNILLLIGCLVLCALGIDLALKGMISQPSDDPSSIEGDDDTIETIKDYLGVFVAICIVTSNDSQPPSPPTFHWRPPCT